MYLMLCLISGAVGGVVAGGLRTGPGRLVNTVLGLAGGGAGFFALILLGLGGTATGNVDLGTILTQFGAGFVCGGALVLLSGWLARIRRG